MAKSLLGTFETLGLPEKHILADIASPKLLAFYALEIAETKCGIDRLSAEEIVACLEMAGVAVKKLSVSRALAVSSGYVSFRKEDGETFYKLMTKGKQEIEKVLGGEKISVVRIEKNQPRTARLEIGDIFRGLSGLVRICDPYYGIRMLDLLDHLPGITKVKFLTSKTNENGRKLHGAMKDFKKERPNMEFKVAGKNAGLHDRFVITNKQLLILGHGLKDIGSKESFIIRLEKDLVPDLIKETSEAFDSKWNSGTTI